MQSAAPSGLPIPACLDFPASVPASLIVVDPQSVGLQPAAAPRAAGVSSLQTPAGIAQPALQVAQAPGKSI